MGFPGGADGNEAACNAGDVSHGFDPWGDRHGNPLQYSCPENLMDRGAWQGTVHRVTKNWTQLRQLSITHTCVCTHTTYIYFFSIMIYHMILNIVLMLCSRTLLLSHSKYSGVLTPEYIISFLPTTKLKFSMFLNITLLVSGHHHINVFMNQLPV